MKQYRDEIIKMIREMKDVVRLQKILAFVRVFYKDYKEERERLCSKTTKQNLLPFYLCA